MSTPDARFRTGQHSDRGPRESNQDTVLSVKLPDGRWLLAVADGMGGLADGEQAGKVALSTLYSDLSDGFDLVAAVERANDAVREEGAGREMGTTLVAAVLDGDRSEVVNIGDSRAYHLDPLGLLQVTRDHTMGQDAIRDGTLTEAEAGSFPMAGALSRYLGSEEPVTADRFGPFQIAERGWLLLCSDGLHKVFRPEELEAILLEESDPDRTAHRLVQEALDRGTEDNVSVVLAFRPGTESRVPLGFGGARSSDFSKSMLPGKKTWRHRSRRRKGRWAILLSLIGVPLLVGAVLALRWWLGSG